MEREREGTYTGLTYVGSTQRKEGQTRSKEHARQAVDGFVPVDVAQSVFREVRSTGGPRMHGHTGRLLGLVLLLGSVQPVCVSGGDLK